MNAQNEHFQHAIKEYIGLIAKQGINAKEHSHRTALENLIMAIQLPLLKITAIQESSDSQDSVKTNGTPDFFIYKDEDSLFKSLVGFIECKKPALELDEIIKGNQIKKYTETCPNIILTNYREFILLNNGVVKERVLLLDKDMRIQDNQTQALINLIFSFYQYEYQPIRTKDDLAKHLAKVSFYYAKSLREFLSDNYNAPHKYYKRLHVLLNDYNDAMHYEFDLTEFCDIFAQSLSYGLCLAKIDTNQKLAEEEFKYIELIPDDYRLLYEFLEKAWEHKSNRFPITIRASLSMTARAINLIDSELIKSELIKANHDKNSIAIYLYEDFLKEYDKLKGTENRKENGVYYTPIEATNFIVRGVNDLLKSHFNSPQGYLQDGVKVLDFACGTGTFLSSLLNEIMPHPEKCDDLTKNQIKFKMLNDYYGFELLFTPYIIAHTILRQKLSNMGIKLETDEDLGVFLTNTLDIDQHSISDLYPETKREHEKALAVKNNDDILAIIGNPPYFNGKSKVKSETLDKEMDIYKQDLAEKNIQPLNDIYLKFMRFADWKMTKAGKGVVGIITNNSYLDGNIHRQMRKTLCEHFDEIYIVNLHGNSHKKETDKNIFDIMVGVSIIFLVKNPQIKTKSVKYFSLANNNLNSRADKLKFLNETKFKSVRWQKLPVNAPNYWFVPRDYSHEKIYKKFIKIPDIFEYFSSAMETRQDKLTIHYNISSLINLKNEFTLKSIENIINKYNTKDGRDWQATNAISDLKNNFNPTRILYRPFDFRFTSLSKLSKSFLAYPVYDLFKHFENKENIGIIFKRQMQTSKFANIFISKLVTEKIILEPAFGGSYLAPLYIYEPLQFSLAGLDENPEEKRANFTEKFTKNYLKKLDFAPSPEEIMAYIYAVLHAPIYREKYLEFLKSDYPSVPMTINREVFTQYAQLGQELIALHLLQPEKIQANSIFCKINAKGKEFTITKIHEPTGNDAGINDILSLDCGKDENISFTGITKDIYNFEIGSYRPIDKWLKYRIKDKYALNHDDLNHIKLMASAISQTIIIMGKLNDLGELYLTDIV